MNGEEIEVFDVSFWNVRYYLTGLQTLQNWMRGARRNSFAAPYDLRKILAERMAVVRKAKQPARPSKSEGGKYPKAKVRSHGIRLHR